MQTYPNDADGDALRRVAADGNDMSQPMVVDFSVAAPNQASAESLARMAEEAGYKAKVSFNAEDEAWDCYCTKSMILTYDNVLQEQRDLDEIGRPFGAHCDGWGTFGNKSSG